MPVARLIIRNKNAYSPAFSMNGSAITAAEKLNSGPEAYNMASDEYESVCLREILKPERLPLSLLFLPL